MNQFLSPISVLILVLALLIGVSVTWLFDTGPRNALRTSERARVVAQNRKPRQVIGAVSLFGVGVLTGGVIFGSYVMQRRRSLPALEIGGMRTHSRRVGRMRSII
jgi:hypothetical protein